MVGFVITVIKHNKDRKKITICQDLCHTIFFTSSYQLYLIFKN